MTIRIPNDSNSVVVRSYAVDSHHTVIWLEMTPKHPKTIGAIWADLVQARRPWLNLGDSDVAGSGLAVRELGCLYERLVADAPEPKSYFPLSLLRVWTIYPNSCCFFCNSGWTYSIGRKIDPKWRVSSSVYAG